MEVVSVATVPPNLFEENNSSALANVASQSSEVSAPCVEGLDVLSSAVPVTGAKPLTASAFVVPVIAKTAMTMSGTAGTGIMLLGSKPVVRLAAARFKVASADAVMRLTLWAPT